MNTEIKHRKTPHSVTSNIFGGKSTDTIWAWAFENGKIDDRPVKKHIPKAQAYVASDNQDLPDNQFKQTDMRPYHVDVWNEKAKNFARYGKFMVNYELREWMERGSLSNFLEND